MFNSKLKARVAELEIFSSKQYGTALQQSVDIAALTRKIERLESFLTSDKVEATPAKPVAKTKPASKKTATKKQTKK